MTTDTKNQTGSPAAADAVEFEAVDRSSFLVKGALAAGALYGAGAITSFVGSAFAQSGSKGDIEILNFALTLEYLETAFYEEAMKKVNMPKDVKALVQQIGADEQAHVGALSQTIKSLGGKPVKEPTFTFDLSDEAGFLKLAATFEDTGVSAYNGAGPQISSKDLLATAGSIVQVEGRHAAAIRIKDGEQPVIEAFDAPLDQAAVLKAVQPFIAS